MEVFGGALLGGVMGVVIAELVRLYQRPRIKFLGIESTKPEWGLAGGEQYLRRIRFEVRGSSAGTATSIQLRWGPDVRQATFAKWDETPEPSEQNPISKEWEHRPNLVPSTFFLPLFAKEQYTVPVLIDYASSSNGARVLDVFCGWWYIENRPEMYRLRVSETDTIKVMVQGMPWIRGWLCRRKSEKLFRVADLQAAPL
jgi:hypothetical protein